MAAIDNLDKAVADLTTKVDQLLAVPAPGDPALQAQIQADADAVNAQTARIDGFITAASVATPR